ncbi:hypothetical protein F0562_004944 [Nyssa sinensis]|uniref:Uncharacterized protein n=1 Tax=Nyssa sinensis TaxID=561372 RepID=A0A5J5AGQ1_9ASTE|nr:hypothetical protein F0562_004944 [Nyssa sinensis]
MIPSHNPYTTPVSKNYICDSIHIAYGGLVEHYHLQKRRRFRQGFPFLIRPSQIQYAFEFSRTERALTSLRNPRHTEYRPSGLVHYLIME